MVCCYSVIIAVKSTTFVILQDKHVSIYPNQATPAQMLQWDFILIMCIQSLCYYSLSCQIFLIIVALLIWRQLFSTRSTVRWERSVPLTFAHFKFQIRPFECAVHVNGVFYWLKLNNRLVAYEYDYDCCFCIPLLESDSYVVELLAMLGELKDGISQYGRSNCFDFRVWVLEDCVSIAGIMLDNEA